MSQYDDVYALIDNAMAKLRRKSLLIDDFEDSDVIKDNIHGAISDLDMAKCKLEDNDHILALRPND